MAGGRFVVAVAEDDAIGCRNRLPWKPLKRDWRRFRKLTLKKPVIMGRETFESLKKPLEGRKNIVLTRNGFFHPGVQVAHSLKAAFEMAGQEAYVIGGAQVYAQALPLATHIHMTRVDGCYEADTFFPPWDESEWEKVFEERHEADEENPVGFSFVDYVRKDVL